MRGGGTANGPCQCWERGSHDLTDFAGGVPTGAVAGVPGCPTDPTAGLLALGALVGSTDSHVAGESHHGWALGLASLMP